MNPELILKSTSEINQLENEYLENNQLSDNNKRFGWWNREPWKS